MLADHACNLKRLSRVVMGSKMTPQKTRQVPQGYLAHKKAPSLVQVKREVMGGNKKLEQDMFADYTCILKRLSLRLVSRIDLCIAHRLVCQSHPDEYSS